MGKYAIGIINNNETHKIRAYCFYYCFVKCRGNIVYLLHILLLMIGLSPRKLLQC